MLNDTTRKLISLLNNACPEEPRVEETGHGDVVCVFCGCSIDMEPHDENCTWLKSRELLNYIFETDVEYKFGFKPKSICIDPSELTS